ncbi:extended synaptotagmin-3-like [Xenopus laevis]|uniref:Extended synaptotagmin-3-like n=1 Tax=Xenopus laevis TaxID=8355 RepID=A0A8J1N092_XENLA|nr:extended synaptotagmin-3-like [Xenopus laevis]
MTDQNIFLNNFSYTKWIITLLLGFSAGVLDVSFFYIIMGIVMWILYRCWKPSTEPSAIKCQDKAKEQAKVPHKVTDREFERLRYLQVLVNNSWPYITKYLEKLLRWRIQPLIRSRFKYLTNFHFFDIDFGNKAPQVTHMRVQSDPEKKQILLDLKISLNAAVMVNVGISKTIMAGVKSVKLEGTLRIILAPLIPDVPFTEAVNIYFPRRPVLHLQWTGLTNLLNIPGLHTMTERMIVDQIANFMVAPKFFTQPLAANFDMKNLPFADPWVRTSISLSRLWAPVPLCFPVQTGRIVQGPLRTPTTTPAHAQKELHHRCTKGAAHTCTKSCAQRTSDRIRSKKSRLQTTSSPRNQTLL